MAAYEAANDAILYAGSAVRAIAHFDRGSKEVVRGVRCGFKPLPRASTPTVFEERQGIWLGTIGWAKGSCPRLVKLLQSSGSIHLN